MARIDGRTPDQLRPVTLTRGWLVHAEGSVLVEFGRTRVLCAASVTEGVPRWRKGSGLGWVTAEYAMLPRATTTRNDRESVRGRIGGRTHEISRLIGRSLRAVIDFKALGENTVVLDCDVLQADGGTRTAAITGAYVALADAVSWAQRKKLIKHGRQPLTGTVSAVHGAPSTTAGRHAFFPILPLPVRDASAVGNGFMTGRHRSHLLVTQGRTPYGCTDPPHTYPHPGLSPPTARRRRPHRTDRRRP